MHIGLWQWASVSVLVLVLSTLYYWLKYTCRLYDAVWQRLFERINSVATLVLLAYALTLVYTGWMTPEQIMAAVVLIVWGFALYMFNWWQINLKLLDSQALLVVEALDWLAAFCYRHGGRRLYERLSEPTS